MVIFFFTLEYHTRLLEGVNDLVKEQQKETNLDEVEKDLNTKKVLAVSLSEPPSLSLTATNQKLRYSLVCLPAGAV